MVVFWSDLNWTTILPGSILFSSLNFKISLFLYPTKPINLFFCKSIGSNFYDCRFDNVQFIENERSSYIFNSSIQEIDNSDAILLVGTNPKWEAAV